MLGSSGRSTRAIGRASELTRRCGLGWADWIPSYSILSLIRASRRNATSREQRKGGCGSAEPATHTELPVWDDDTVEILSNYRWVFIIFIGFLAAFLLCAVATIRRIWNFAGRSCASLCFSVLSADTRVPDGTPLIVRSREMSLAAESFTENVERFCDWAEGDAHTLIEGRQHLITLMSSIPWIEDFRDAGSDDADVPTRGHDGWKEDHRRFADLPFQYYRSVFDPHDFDSTDVLVTGDLHDDFADIYGDLWHGLQAHRAGQTKDALAHWVNSYFHHWGHHASSVLKAIDEFYCANQERKRMDTNA